MSFSTRVVSADPMEDLYQAQPFGASSRLHHLLLRRSRANLLLLPPKYSSPRPSRMIACHSGGLAPFRDPLNQKSDFGLSTFGTSDQRLKMAEQEAPAEGEAGESPIALSFEIMKPALKGLARTVDGTGFALTHLELRDQNLGDIAAVSGYKHLRYMDLSGNKISDIKPLEGLDHLLSINLSQNKIAALELPALQFLQVRRGISASLVLTLRREKREREREREGAGQLCQEG